MLVGDRRVALGTLALTIVNALKLALQVAVLPILARILGPSAVGLVALAAPLILLATYVADAGLGNALVLKRDSSPELESTIFWLSLGISLALAMIVSVLAWPLSTLLSQPKLPFLIVALTLILPMAGLLSVPNARISREGKFGLFAVGDVISSLTSSAIAIAAALAGAGPWSLVLQQCVLWLAKVVWLVPTSGFRPRLFCRPSLAWPYLGFSLNAVGAGLADFGNKNFPTLVVGGLIGVAAAGHYSMAYQIVRMPEMIISGPLYLSIFASVAKWGDNRNGTVPLAVKGLRGLVTILAPLFCGLALVAHLAVRILLGPAWVATETMLVLLAPAGFLMCIYSFTGAILMGLGRSQYQFRLVVVSGCCLATGALVGSRFGGDGVALGFSIGATLVVPVYLFVLSRQLGMAARALAREVAPPLVATAVMALIVSAMLNRAAALSSLTQLSLAIACGVASYAVVLAMISGRRLREDLRWMMATDRDAEPELLGGTPHCE